MTSPESTGPSPSHEHAETPSVFDADLSSGLTAEARGGLESQGGHSHPAEAGGFVREATPADLEAIGAVHAAAMRASLEAAHAAAHDGAPLPAGVAAMIAAPVLAAGWEGAVVEPPSTRHHVLVATLGDEVVGIVALAPTQGVVDEKETTDAPASVREPEPAAEITALGVLPEHQREGHGSRLLAAATDYARQDGARVLLQWAVRGDESVSGLLAACGLERTESRRELPVGQGVTEDCWAAAL
ncbi:GNAT family N-acetyltransferase [Actinomyces haliotis]|uniref:GNAT family N-acetyltransferase n=1 Tax=Actinomyces haliotis TaxID=1280843 RepID=UPI00188EF1B2|nr:GNAT family N-acetyltransferase [Actinomyces haliotis]